MIIKDIMIQKVVTIDSNDSVFNACIKLLEERIGCIIVLDKGFCVGIITERDFIERTILMNRDPEETKVKDIMTPDIVTIKPLDKIEDALQIMKKFRIKKLPVVNNDDLIGIVTISDIAHARPELTKRFIESWIKPRWDE
jgi:CBS domain-containing protein